MRHAPDNAVDIGCPDPLAQQVAYKSVAQHRRRYFLRAVELGIVGGEQDKPRHVSIGQPVAGGFFQNPAGSFRLPLLPGGQQRVHRLVQRKRSRVGAANSDRASGDVDVFPAQCDGLFDGEPD